MLFFSAGGGHQEARAELGLQLLEVLLVLSEGAPSEGVLYVVIGLGQ